MCRKRLRARLPLGSGRVILGIIVALILAGGVGTARAHMELARGRLVDLAQRSDDILAVRIATVTDDRLTGSNAADDTAVVIAVAPGMALEADRSYVFFVSGDPEARVSLHPTGMVLPVENERIAPVLDMLRQLAAKATGPDSVLQAMLIRLLAAPEEELRYHAALDLLALVHPGHPLTPKNTDGLAAWLGSPHVDPVLAPLLQRFIVVDGAPSPTATAATP